MIEKPVLTKIVAGDLNAKLHQPLNDIERTDDSIKTTKELSEWFEKENINFRIISDINSASEKIKRIKSINEIRK